MPQPDSASPIPVALTIAGSDSGGGAGVQADLKTFAFHQVHGTSAITCVTAQNTLGVQRVDALPPEAVLAQLEAVQSDIGIQALKTGMLLNAEIVAAVTQWLQDLCCESVVIDPVMVSRAGAVLLQADAIAQIKARLIPQALIVTPNRYEAELLTGLTIRSLDDIEQAARSLHTLGPKFVLIKGGGLPDPYQAQDFWFDGYQLHTIQTQHIQTPHTHGTGCTLGAAIVANLALGYAPLESVKRAKQYVTRALKYALAIGQGQGPVGHWHPLIAEA